MDAKWPVFLSPIYSGPGRRNILPTFNELNIPLGFMTDHQIKLALENGFLIQNGSWEAGFVRHASYTLRIGDRIEIAHATAANIEEERYFKRIDLSPTSSVELRPGDTAKLYSIEVLNLPQSVLAFTVARGLMFFESLVPENTYVDPGFTGNLYTTVTNLSNRNIHLDYGDPITRLFFYKLAEDVEESYIKGSAKGLKQRLKSSRATALGTEDECRKAGRADIIKELRQIPLGGTQMAALAQKEFNLTLALFLFALLWPPLFFLGNTNAWLLHTFGRAISNVGSVVASFGLSKLVPYAWERLRRI
jgi:deoxycytidine triphosphate deaminase